MSQEAGPLLAVNHVGHAFGGFRVLSDVSFSVEPGSIIGLIGPNGSGKTTLFNIISGFIRPGNGSVKFKNVALGNASVARRSQIGLVRTFQTPKVFEHLTVLENLMVGLYKCSHGGLLATMLRLGSARRQMSMMVEQAQSACAEFGLGNLKDQLAGSLTAGQRRNVELARACISKPSIVLLDEPSSGLSSEEIRQLKDMLAQVNKRGFAILLVSHDMNLMSIADRVNVLSAGSIIASGTMEDVAQNSDVKKVYLGI